MKITIDVNQKLDECGDKFLDERDFEIQFDFSSDKADWRYVNCTVDGKKNCMILKSDLKQLLRVLEIENK